MEVSPATTDPALLATEATGVSPFAEAARIDWRPLVHELRELPLEVTDAAAAALGKANPARQNAWRRFWTHPGSGWLGFGPWVCVCFTFPVAFFAPRIGLPLLAAWVSGIVVVITTKLVAHRGQANLLRLRVAALQQANPGVVVELADRADASALLVVGRLRKGELGQWVGPRLRIHGGPVARVDLELGIYCRRMDGDKSNYTVHEGYLFVPMPPDVRSRVTSWFHVEPKGLLTGRTDVSLSGPFDERFVVHTTDPAIDPASASFATRALAPDVQQLALRYGQAEFVLSPDGFFARLPAAYDALGERGRHSTAEGAMLLGNLTRMLHLAHEVLEQLDPAYKLDRATQQAVLRQFGLEGV